MKKDLSLKVYYFRIDMEDKDGYSENMVGFNILAETIEEAIEEVKKRIVKNKNYIIGDISLVVVID